MRCFRLPVVIFIALLALASSIPGGARDEAAQPLTPAVIAYDARQRKQSFTFPLPPGVTASAKMQAEVLFQHGTNPPRSYSAQTNDGRAFQVAAVPLPATDAPEKLRLTAQDNGSEMVCLIRDLPIRVSGKAVRLSAVSRVDLGDRPRVTLADGQKLEGAVTGLDKIEVQMFGAKTTLDLRRASVLLVEDLSHLPLTVNYRIRFRREKIVVFEQHGALQIAPPAAVAAENRPRRANVPITFQPPRTYNVPAATDIITAGRIDEDRWPDVVVAAGEELGILYGQEKGTFALYTQLLPWKAGVANEALFDINGDNRPDILFNDRLGKLVILFNKGKRQFTEPVFRTYDGILGLRFRDMNGDKIPDLLGAQPGTGVRVMLNDGKGDFRDYQAVPFRSIDGFDLGDINSDGLLDMVIGNNSSTVGGAGVTLFYGEVNGKYRQGPHYPLGTSSMFRSHLTDLNKDGKVDLVQCDYWGHNLAVLLNKGDGTFNTALRYPAAGYPIMSHTVDLNGDGNLDIVVAGAGNSKVSIYRNRGDGTFYDPEMVETEGNDCRSCAIVDVNLDGKPDLITQNQATRTISVLINTTGS